MTIIFIITIIILVTAFFPVFMTESLSLLCYASVRPEPEYALVGRNSLIISYPISLNVWRNFGSLLILSIFFKIFSISLIFYYEN
jgi:hypothetical protein